jgi:hypoxanthine-guanine phosphoribosyltransferase
VDLPEDHHKDGWISPQHQSVSWVKHHMQSAAFMTDDYLGFSFDGNYIVGGSDEGEIAHRLPSVIILTKC